MSQTSATLVAALADRYVIARELGEGGMATVYLAHDLKHERPVAIKVLHEDLGATLGPERFLAEIKTTAKLQHPHILALLDSGAVGGLLYYVMPFVDGETLRDRLTRDTQLPIEDALRIAREVADALGHAHGQGIVHRDIKPENILLQGGHAVVADFGIALAVQQAGGARLTQTGLSLGTPQYMSPEQAMGDKHVGPAADLYALGAVTYEMLTGDPPFTGSTVQAIVAKVLSERPTPVRTIRETVPSAIESAVHRALAKLPADRFTSAVQFAEALATGAAVGSAAAVTRDREDDRAAIERAMRRWRLGAIVATTAAVGALWFGALSARGAGSAVQLQQYDVVLPDSAPIRLVGSAIDISPDGAFVVYAAMRGDLSELWYRSLVDTAARPLPGTLGGNFPTISPDGRAVAFLAEDRVKLASLAGEPVRELGKVRRPEGIAWRTNDQVIVGDVDLGLTAFDRLGGPPRTLSPRDCGTTSVVSESSVLCGMILVDLDADSGRVIRLESGDRDVSTAPPVSGTFAEALDAEHLLYTALDGSVIAARWTRSSNTVRQRTVVLTGVRTESVYGYRQAAVSRSGTLAFVPGTSAGAGRLVRSDGRGPAQQLPIDALTAGQFDVSPDGRSIAVIKVSVDGEELWVHDLASGQGSRWARATNLTDPRWSPDSRRVAILAFEPPGPPATVLLTEGRTANPDTLPGVAANPNHWYSETRMLGSVGPSNRSSLVWIDWTAAGRVRVDTIRGSVSQSRGVVSSDTRLVVHAAADEIVVQTLDGRHRHVINRGIDPHWLDRRTIVYRTIQNGWHRAMVDDLGAPVATPRAWLEDQRFIDTNQRSDAVTPRGEIIYLQGSGKSTATSLRVIPRWADKARAAVAAAEAR